MVVVVPFISSTSIETISWDTVTLTRVEIVHSWLVRILEMRKSNEERVERGVTRGNEQDSKIKEGRNVFKKWYQR